jgi:hypothetical protein
LIPAALAGVFVVYAKTKASDRLGFREFWDWLSSLGNILAIGTATVAAIGIWFTQYWKNGSWGGSLVSDYWTLLGLMTGTFIATATAFTAVSDRVGSS